MLLIFYDLSHRHIFIIGEDCPWYIPIPKLFMMKHDIRVTDVFILVIFELLAILTNTMFLAKSIPQGIGHPHTTPSDSKA